MKIDDRKAAIAAYRKRKSAVGIYAVRCAASGKAWIGQTHNLETVQNRIWFSLRAGGHGNRDLQSDWQAHGAEAVSFEPLEQLKDEELPYIRDALLRERFVHWRSTLNGLSI